jgi:tRNA 2-thiouridine synthesizing protein A
LSESTGLKSAEGGGEEEEEETQQQRRQQKEKNLLLLASKKVDEKLDVLGEICPYPQLYTKKKLEKMAEGKVLEVVTDHPPAAEETIPGYCRQMGYPFSVKKEGSIYRIVIRKERGKEAISAPVTTTTGDHVK